MAIPRRAGLLVLPLLTSRSIEEHGLVAELVAEPGTKLAYNNQAADFLSVLARRADPESLFLDDIMQRDLLSLLGIVGAHWLKDGHGHPRVAGELSIRPIDLLKLGQLTNRSSWDAEEFTWRDFVWDVLTLAGHEVPVGDRNGFAQRGSGAS